MWEWGFTRCGVWFAAKARGVLPGAGGPEAGAALAPVSVGSPSAAGRGAEGGSHGGSSLGAHLSARARRAGHQLPGPLSRPDESSRRGPCRPARSRPRPRVDPRLFRHGPSPWPSGPSGSHEEPDGDKRGRRGGTGWPRCRDGKTEAREGRPRLQRVPSAPRARPQHRGRKGGQKCFVTEDGRKLSPHERDGRGVECGPSDGSADRRLVICKKFISTFKKRENPRGLAAPGPGLRLGTGVGVGGQAPSAPSCPAWEWGGHRPQTH